MSFEEKEIWRDIKGYETLYQVSNFGRVRSLGRWKRASKKLGGWAYLPPKIMKLYTAPHGYKRVGLNKEGRQIAYFVHHLVLLSFVGSRPPNTQGCYFPDMNPGNNRADNLRWDTIEGNRADTNFYGRQSRGSKRTLSKLKESDIPIIRKLMETGNFSQREMGEIYGVDHAVIGRILLRRIWKHV